MRAFALFALLLPVPALADQILATSKITAVTVFPQMAQITREVSFDAPAGQHELLITDLPYETAPEFVRINGDAALGLGAFSLRNDRLPPRDEATDPALLAAKVEIETAEAGVRAAEAALAAINARIDATAAQAGFLANAKAEGAGLTPEGLKALAQMIGTEVLAAKQAGLSAAADLPAVQKALDEAGKALARAQEAYAALSQGDVEYTGLFVTVTAATEGAHSLTVTHYVGSAGWEPVYDMMLTRKGGASLTIRRGVLVSQYTGEDWVGVALKLSTAQPSAQAAPSGLLPELRQIVDPAAEAKMERVAEGMMEDSAVMAAPEAMVTSAIAGIKGDVVVYTYPGAVDVATGVENLRLALDEIAVKPKVEARAVPRADKTAFVVARFTNEAGEILLPGQAFLMREGTLVGSTYLEVLAPGAEAEVGFGAIEGLRLTRDMPLRAEGDRGILSTSTQIEEKAVLKVENLTDEAWAVRLMDMVPYSEQEDLEITYEADPAPTEVDVKGQRGILAWEFDLAPGAAKEVALTHVMSWPEGMALQ